MCFQDKQPKGWAISPPSFACSPHIIRLVYSSSEMTTLYLVRHGQTIDNVNQIMQGQTQGRLTPLGVHQAEELADTLADTHFDAFVSSDLQRAIDTCTLIANRRCMAVETTALLRERDWGGFTGRFIPDLKDEVWPPDVETMGQLKDRARRFLLFIKKRYPSKTVLAVGHGIINKAIQAVYHDIPIHEVPRMQNAEVRILSLI